MIYINILKATKKILKDMIFKFYDLIAYFIMFPYIIEYSIFKNNYKSIAIRLSSYKGEFGFVIRRKFYERTLKRCGNNLRVHYGAYIVYPTVEIGNNVCVEEYSIVSNCIISDDVIIAARVSIMSGAHHHEVNNLNVKFNESNGDLKKVNIGSNVWIGTHAVIMNDIYKDVIIGAGSVVTKVIPERSVAVGVPARVKSIRGRNG